MIRKQIQDRIDKEAEINITLHVDHDSVDVVTKTHQCFTCGYATSLKTDYLSHLRTHLKSYQCSKCSFLTNSKYTIENHMKFLHSIKSTLQIDYGGVYIMH